MFEPIESGLRDGIGPEARLRYRKVGEGGVLFDRRTWRTHFLTPAAAAVYEALLEASDGASLDESAAVGLMRNDLGLDPAAPAILRLVKTLKSIGVVAE